MITKINRNDYFDKDIVDIYVDTEDELLQLTDIPHATKAYVIQTKKIKILNGDDQWVEMIFGNSEGSGSSSEESSDVFIVNIIPEYNSETNQTIYTSSATFQEIIEAINANKHVIGWEMYPESASGLLCMKARCFADVSSIYDGEWGDIWAIRFSRTEFINSKIKTETYTISNSGVNYTVREAQIS